MSAFTECLSDLTFLFVQTLDLVQSTCRFVCVHCSRMWLNQDELSPIIIAGWITRPATWMDLYLPERTEVWLVGLLDYNDNKLQSSRNLTVFTLPQDADLPSPLGTSPDGGAWVLHEGPDPWKDYPNMTSQLHSYYMYYIYECVYVDKIQM